MDIIVERNGTKVSVLNIRQGDPEEVCAGAILESLIVKTIDKCLKSTQDAIQDRQAEAG
jgi:phosphoribosylamine-glycine ligase